MDENVSGVIGSFTSPYDEENQEVDYSFRLLEDISGNFGLRFGINNKPGRTADLVILPGSTFNFEDMPSGTMSDSEGLYVEVEVVAIDRPVTDPDAQGIPNERKSDVTVFKVYVRNVNEYTPVVSNVTFNVTEGANVGRDVGSINGSDGDAGQYGVLRHYFRDSNNGSARLTTNDGWLRIDPESGQVEVNNSSIDYEASSLRTYQILTRDNAGQSGYRQRTSSLTLNVQNADDEAPTLSGQTASDNAKLSSGVVLREDTVVNTAIVNLQATDVDTHTTIPENTEFTYSLDTTHGGRFTIDPYGIVRLAGTLVWNGPTSYTIGVTATEKDSDRASNRVLFTVEVDDVEDKIWDFTSRKSNVPGRTSIGSRDGYDAIYETGSDPSGGSTKFWETVQFTNDDGYVVAYYDSEWTPSGGFGGGFQAGPPNFAAVGGYLWRNTTWRIDAVLAVVASGDLQRLEGTRFPVVIDLDGDGVEIISASGNYAAFDFDGDGGRQRGDWVHRDDALLVLDRDGNGVIDNGTEISFVDDLPGAKTDLEGLRAFDSNADGRFTAEDERFTDFQLWQDLNGDGVSQSLELFSLSERGVIAIDLGLTSTGQEYNLVDESIILNTAIVELNGGRTTEAGDALFRYLKVNETDEQLADLAIERAKDQFAARWNTEQNDDALVALRQNRDSATARRYTRIDGSRSFQERLLVRGNRASETNAPTDIATERLFARMIESMAVMDTGQEAMDSFGNFQRDGVSDRATTLSIPL